MWCSKSFISCIFPAFRNFYFYDLFCTSIDCIVVHLNDLVTFSSVSSLSSCFHKVNSLFFRNDSCKFEECRLKNCIDTSAKSDLFTNLDTIDCVEFNSVVSDISFYLSRKMLLKSFHIPWAVQKECSSINKFLNHVVFVNIRRVMTCNKVSLMDQVC